MRRPDLADLVRYATGTGLTVALTPSGTAAATRARLAELKAAGLSRVAVSLDGPTPEAHDAFRGVRGSYAWTMRIIESAVELGLPLQINSTISRRTLADFDDGRARRRVPLTLWALFFSSDRPRRNLAQITDDECERVLNRLYDLSPTVPSASRQPRRRTINASSGNAKTQESGRVCRRRRSSGGGSCARRAA
jgi:MoaA/NifB/PqqE/SkfB family radical SAM enzyme